LFTAITRIREQLSPSRRHLMKKKRFCAMKSCEVVVVGAGPAGLVAAIAARRRGLDVTVLDARIPPIDKPCGEGILPRGLAALRELGIFPPSESTLAFHGIRFVDGLRSARADFSGSTGFSMRRTRLHQFLIDRAVHAGVELLWGTRVMRIGDGFLETSRETYGYRWLVGADGQNSRVRKWAGLDTLARGQRRFGFCSHFGVAPWSDTTEVHWADGCQIFITPMCGAEVGVAVLSSDPGLRLDRALSRFPDLAEKLRDARQTTRESGDTTSVRILGAVARRRVALIGDASGTVDALTGHGLSLAFQQAIPLAEAIRGGDLDIYRSAHKRIAAVPNLMTRLMLLMSENSRIRGRTIRLFQDSPGLFSRLLAIHTEAAPLSSVGVGELASFGWQFLKA
jgi:menaquinone-9 beta-reductase